jgi:WD40 repeat protein
MLVITNGLRATGVAFSPDGTLLAAFTNTGLALRVYDSRTGQRLWAVPPLPNHGGNGTPAFSPDGRYVVRPWVWREVFAAGTGERVDPLPPGEAPGGDKWPMVWIGDNRRYSLLSSPDGRWAVGDSLREVKDWKTSQEWIELYPRHGRGAKGEDVPLWALVPYSFSPDSRFLAAGMNTRLYLLRLPEFEIVAEMSHHPKAVQGAAFTADGRYVISVSNAATARVWDAVTGAEVHAYAWDVGPLKCVAVAPDGCLAACGGDKGKVVVWDLDL